jgi:mRNA interferase MazF
VRRGDIVTVALQGDHGKSRPALIVQSDQFTASTHVAVLLLTSFQLDAPLLRVAIAATAETGLAGPSSAILDRITTAQHSKVGAVIGHLDDATMLMVNRALAVFLGLA